MNVAQSEWRGTMYRGMKAFAMSAAAVAACGIVSPASAEGHAPTAVHGSASATCTSNMCFWMRDKYKGNTTYTAVNRGICFESYDSGDELLASAKIRFKKKVRFYALPGCKGRTGVLSKGNYPDMDAKIGFSPQSFKRA